MSCAPGPLSTGRADTAPCIFHPLRLVARQRIPQGIARFASRKQLRFATVYDIQYEHLDQVWCSKYLRFPSLSTSWSSRDLSPSVPHPDCPVGGLSLVLWPHKIGHLHRHAMTCHNHRKMSHQTLFTTSHPTSTRHAQLLPNLSVWLWNTCCRLHHPTLLPPAQVCLIVSLISFRFKPGCLIFWMHLKAKQILCLILTLEERFSTSEGTDEDCTRVTHVSGVNLKTWNFGNQILQQIQNLEPVEL